MWNQLPEEEDLAEEGGEVQSEDPASALRIILPVRGREQPYNAACSSIRVTANILRRQDQCKAYSLYDFTLVVKNYYTQWAKRTKPITHVYICNVLNLWNISRLHSGTHCITPLGQLPMRCQLLNTSLAPKSGQLFHEYYSKRTQVPPFHPMTP